MKLWMYSILLGVPVLAQEFEVATIKPSESANPHEVRMQMAPGGRVMASNFTLSMLIQQAYQVRDFQISGGPSWIKTERFDISAKGSADTPPGPESMRAMMQKLLKDRFGLELHKESKEGQVYNLVLAKGGSKLKEVEAPPPPSGPGAGGPGGPGRPGGPGGRRMVRMGRGQLDAQTAPMSLLVAQLASAAGRPIVDKTGLTGFYDFKLEWTPDNPAGPPIEGHPAPTESSAPSLFTAVQEQLGLKLESAKGPVDLLVIDKANKPSEN